MNGRIHLYREVHKGVRRLLTALGRSADRTDFADARAVARLRDEARAAFALLTAHAEHEQRFLVPLVQAAAPESSSRNADDHLVQELQIDRLQKALDGFDARGADAAARGHEIVVELSRFTGEVLVHMAEEEQVLMPTLWDHYDDAALEDAHRRILASVPPEENAAWGRWMLPAVNAPERLALVAGMRAAVPPAVFARLRAMAREVLSPEDDAELELGLTYAEPLRHSA